MLFRTANPTQIRCQAACRTTQQRNAARTQARADYKPEFIGVDGEGVTLADGTHKYVLLSVGEDALHKEGEYLEFNEIAEFLWARFLDNPSACFVGYYLGYDFAQWLRTLPEDRAAMLYTPEKRQRTNSGNNPTPFPVYYGDWEFDSLGTKRFKLRKAGADTWLYICDVGGFFQQPFATAIIGWQDRNGNPLEIATPDELELIEKGKAKRATAKFDKEMMRYNAAENRVLARMMGVLAEGFADMGVMLRRQEWFGPGQVAQKWMDEHSTHKAKILKEKADNDETFRGAIDAARASYYGGWFETYAHGHVRGRAYEYDITSAYPHVHSNLPCLLHGNWRHESDLQPDSYNVSDYVLMRADVEGDNKYIGAMLHRDRTGKINRPHYTSGWFWQHELDAAKRAGLVCKVTAHEAYIYTPCKCAPPMQKLRELFDLRNAVGKNTPQGRGLKLTYNSCYGKTAQSIGTPKHANAIHASLITAGCRTMILDAIATHPKGAASVLMIATDGIYFDTPHPGLQGMPTALGNWEETIKENLTIFLPGVYWDDVSRASRAKKAFKLKSRGVSAADLIARLDALDAEFDRMLLEPIPWTLCEGLVPDEWWAKIQLQLRFSMVSPKQALQRKKWHLAGTVTQAGTRDLWAHPRHKREMVFGPSEERPYIHTTRPTNRKRIASTPYNKSFGLELAELQDAEFVLTPEGDAMKEAYEIIRGEK